MANANRLRVPAVDVLENDECWKLVADLPRATRDQLDLTVNGGVLRIRAELSDGGGYERSFRLPQGVDGGAVEAGLDQGVLTLTIPKPQEVRPRRIAVA